MCVYIYIYIHIHLITISDYNELYFKYYITVLLNGETAKTKQGPGPKGTTILRHRRRSVSSP